MEKLAVIREGVTPGLEGVFAGKLPEKAASPARDAAPVDDHVSTRLAAEAAERLRK